MRRKQSPFPPYLKWRDGRPRWEPGPTLRSAGFKGEDLRDDNNRWLGMEAAIARAKLLNEHVEAWRSGGAPRRRQEREQKPARSCRALYDLWLQSPKFAKLAPATQRDYRLKAELWLDTFGDAPVHVLKKHDVYGWWEEAYREHGHSMANGTVAVVRSMLTYGTMKGWRDDNPAMKLGLETLPPRVVIWTPQECAAMVTTADAFGLHAIGDASVIALHTAQRLSDVLALQYSKTERGYVEFLQGKTKARVRVPQTDQLEQRLAAIRGRRSRGTTVSLQHIARVVLRDDTMEPHTGRSFNEAFNTVKRAVAADHPDAASKWFLDFRDTAITRLALAGATLPEIRAISGHKLDTIASVLQHYLALDHRMADAGVAKLKEWMASEGIAV